MSCLDVTNKHSWDTNWHFGARQHWLFIFCVENIYPSGFKVLSSLGSMCSNKKVQLSLWKSGRGKTVFTSDILLKEQREPLKEGSSAIHPPLWGHCLTEVTEAPSFLTLHFFGQSLALTPALLGPRQFLLQVAHGPGSLLTLTLQEAVFLLQSLKHTVTVIVKANASARVTSALVSVPKGTVYLTRGITLFFDFWMKLRHSYFNLILRTHVKTKGQNPKLKIIFFLKKCISLNLLLVKEVAHKGNPIYKTLKDTSSKFLSHLKNQIHLYKDLMC